jgi:diaminopimelate epimerase
MGPERTEWTDQRAIIPRRALSWRAVKFEKWQALGNDYVIVEIDDLPWELTPGRVRAICASHTGVGSDGILLLSDPGRPVMRVFNPDGSEAEVSGNGARQAILYLYRHGYTGPIRTAAGELHAAVTSETNCTVDMGTARLESEDFPSGPPDGSGELDAGGRRWRFRHVQVGNPQCAIAVTDETELRTVDITRVGAEIERHELFPNRTNVSWFAPLAPGMIRVRIFERGVGETTASGTGATGAAVAYVLDGGNSPVTVVLDGGELVVEVGRGLEIGLTGWAVPVFRGTLAEDFIEELRAIE